MLRCIILKLYTNAITKITLYAKNAEEKNGHQQARFWANSLIHS